MAASVAWGDEEAAGMHRGSHLKVRSVCEWCLSRKAIKIFWGCQILSREAVMGNVGRNCL